MNMTDEEIYETYWKPAMIELTLKFDQIVLDILTDNSVGAEENQELWID